MAIRGSSLARAYVPVGGPAGLPGQSTYAAWLALGNTGELADFVAAQKGAPGGVTTLAGKVGALGLDDIGALAKTGDASGTKVRLAIAAAVARAVTDRATDHGVTPQDFGAVGDGVADDTTALRSWLAALGLGRRGAMPPGLYRFTQPLQFPIVSNLSLAGSGSHSSVFWYDGPDAAKDIITIGDTTSSISQVRQCNLSGFRVASNLKMTAGAGLRMRGLVRSVLRDIIADGQDGNGNLFHGLWFDQVDMVVLGQYEARAQGDAVRLNGALGNGAKAGLFLHQGKIAGSGVGIRVGGAFGGFSLEQTDVIANGTNMIVDTTLTAEGNREVFIGATVSFDSAQDASSASIVLDDSLIANGIIAFTGTWNTSGPGHGLWVKNWRGSDLIWTGGTIGAFTDNVRVDDASARATFSGGLAIRAARAYGVNPTVAGHAVVVSNVRGVGNALGTLNATYQAGRLLTSSELVPAVATTGLTLSNDVTTPASVINIGPGSATSSPRSGVMAMFGVLNKSILSTWVAGTGGGLDTGAVASSTWYHVFLISNPSTGAVDALFSLSPSTPTLPAGYLLYRRIGSVRTDASSNILPFKQTGSTFVWTASVTDLNGGASTTASLVPLTVPTGVQVEALFRAGASSSSPNGLMISSPDAADEVPTFPNYSLTWAANTNAFGEFRVRTDTFGRIRARSSVDSTIFGVRTYGWVDPR
ncbi:hypothetical protein ABID82_007270 [Methylobacterium sp. PvP062]|uniref:Pectate lyase superfamily protein domain-containing protein n=1 Tax=Methylobacterium radiotolerans TaxID=31998 RepID=A0ABV2NPW3_9HYPH|nr:MULTISPECIES: hypothetical protein [unclassified Methylobacterium]MBP2494726.1 hypothetical protein [Methylobacterium sp. PvP105]MBP2494925.1 hypothetical protein [Methylobacterium sp. PvP105]MBP2505204.1 hypothetical protein [Methylobacterium sp. PvP109]MBP2505403.1 hypothetical protein [Methylobacterium sp. PvP109]